MLYMFEMLAMSVLLKLL